jgi:hypothetical protein
VFFHDQTVGAVVEAMTTLERSEHRFDAKALRARAEGFDRPLFRERIATYLAQVLGC